MICNDFFCEKCQLFKKSVECVVSVEKNKIIFDDAKKGGSNLMKRETKKKTLEILAKMAMATATKEANSACFLFGYQPKVPDELKKMRKKK